MSGWRSQLVLLLWLLHPAGVAAGPRPSAVLMLIDESLQTPLWPDRFVLTLGLQLHPYRIEVRKAPAALPESIEDQVRLARDIGRRVGVIAVVWCTTARAGQPASIGLVDLRPPGTIVHWLTVGDRAPGLERSLAVAVRTLLLAAPLGAVVASGPSAATRSSPPASGRASPLVEQPRPLPRLRLGAGYSIDAYPVGGEVRHGPDLGVSVRIWRQLEGQLSFGYRLPRRGGDRLSRWSQSDLRLCWGVSSSWVLRGRWEILAGLQASVSRLAAEAQDLAVPRVESLTLWEVSLGGTGGVGLRLGRRLELVVGTVLAWLPLRHSLVVRGITVSEAGALEISVATGLRVSFY